MTSLSKTPSERSKATITELSTLFTTTPHHPPTLPAHLPLWPALEAAYTTALATFSLPEDATRPLSRPASAAAPRVLSAIFNTDAPLLFRAFGPSLAPEDGALLLAQGVAGLAFFFRGLADAAGSTGEVSGELLAHELEVFRKGEERAAVLAAVEESDEWAGCGTRGMVEDVILKAVERIAAADDDGVGGRAGSWLQEGGRGSDGAGWDEEGALWGGEVVGRPRNMGLPWGFSILPVN